VARPSDPSDPDRSAPNRIDPDRIAPDRSDRGPGDASGLPVPVLGSADSPFVLEQPIGAGAAGTVYRARLRHPLSNLPKGAPVAVKFLHSHLAGDPEAQERLAEEGRLGQEVESPYVARIHGVGTNDVLGMSVTWLVMEYLEGKTLRAFLDSQRRAVEDLTRRIGRDVAAGLAALHSRGIVHRDIKPENLHLTPAGTVKVMDLGLARRIGRGEARVGGSPAGTLLYSAPEVLNGRAATPQSDLWALGVVLYELATGHHPFAASTSRFGSSRMGSQPSSSPVATAAPSPGRTPTPTPTPTPTTGADELIHAVLHQEPIRPSHLQPRISAFLEQLILQLLQKVPAARPIAASGVAESLELGEASPWWQERTTRAPILTARTRLRRIRRSAPTEFVDRDEPRALLDRHHRALLRGKGALVAVSGPPGIGRRRLLDEAIEAWLDGRDAIAFAWGLASSEPELGRGQPFPELLADAVLGEPPGGPRLRERIEARLSALTGWSSAAIGRVAQSLAGDATALDAVDGAALFADLVALLARRHPLVLRIDRADQLDDTACRVLTLLARQKASLPVLVLLTAGSEGLPAAAPPAVTIELGGLEREPFVQFATALFAPGAAPTEALETAAATFGGSPGNLVEALEHLVECNQLRGQPGGYEGFAGPIPIAPAPSHLERVQERLRRLPPEQQHVLQAAAVLGDRFPIADLAAVVGRAELHVLDDLSVFRGRVVRAVAGHVSFRHHAFRDALQRRLPTGLRQRLHRLAAFALQERNAPPLQVGLHLSRAGEHGACVPLLLDALDGLMQSGSKRTAKRVAARLALHLERLASASEASVPLERWTQRFTMLRARLARRLGDRTTAARHLRDALARGAERQDGAARAEALVELADMAREAGQFLAALGMVESAYQATPTPGEGEPRATAVRAHALHAEILAWLGHSEEGIGHLRTALRLTPDADPKARAALLIELARHEILLRHLPTADKTLRRAAHLTSPDDPPAHRAHLAFQRGRLAQLVGGDGDATLDHATQLAEDADLPVMLGRIGVARGESALWKGADADDWLGEAEEYAKRGGDKVTAEMARVHRLGAAHRTQSMAAAVEDLGAPELLAWWLWYEARRHEVEGNRALRRVCIDEALDISAAATLPLRLELRILIAAGRGDRARQLVNTLAARFPPGAARRRFVHEIGRHLP